MGDDQRILEAARISYRAPSKGEEQDKKLLHYLWKNKHTSPFEMVKVTFNIKMPIFVMRQYVRHRMQNLNEVSARYTELPNEFYVPAKWRKQDSKNKQGSVATGELDHAFLSHYLQESNKVAYSTYKWLLEQGVAREMARMVLPVNIYTEIYACWDLKNLLHFITLREDSHAQAEIQEYGKAIKSICSELFPWTLEAYEQYKWKLDVNE
jgi:thymidylate synthase (FAD)